MNPPKRIASANSTIPSRARKIPPSDEIASWTPKRTFGVEIEVNAFDGQISSDAPEGIAYIARLVSEAAEERVVVRQYEKTINNDCWIVKPDGSCGIEICSPVSKGWRGLHQICRVVESLGENRRVSSDGRCSFHVHVGIPDLSTNQVASVVAHWIKCEPIFIDSFPPRRKASKYCQSISASDLYRMEDPISPERILSRIAKLKYLTLCIKYYMMESLSTRRDSLEFRLAEEVACGDASFAKNWVRICVQFVEEASKLPIPGDYVPGDRFSGLCSLDAEDVLSILGLDRPRMSLGLKEMGDWLLTRLRDNTGRANPRGIWGDPRKQAYRDLIRLCEGRDILSAGEMAEMVYHEDYRY